MGKICDFKNKIIEAIIEHYSDVGSVNGDDLDELGKWIDICKDIEEMRHYEYMAKNTKKVIEAMDNVDGDGNKSLDSVIQSLENIIIDGMPDMSDNDVAKCKRRLEKIISEM